MIMKRIINTMLVVVSILMLSGCKDDKEEDMIMDEANIYGVWKMTLIDGDYKDVNFLYFQKGGRLVVANTEYKNGIKLQENVKELNWQLDFTSLFIYYADDINMVGINRLTNKTLEIFDGWTLRVNTYYKSSYSEIKPYIEKYL